MITISMVKEPVNRRCGLITREKCSYADKYKATRQPTCGCRVCWNKWVKAL